MNNANGVKASDETCICVNFGGFVACRRKANAHFLSSESEKEIGKLEFEI